MDDPQFYKVRSVLQCPKSGEMYVKIDYFDLTVDGNDFIHGSFVNSIRNFYEKAKFTIISVTQKAISEGEYALNAE